MVDLAYLKTYVYLWQSDSMQINTRTLSLALSWLLLLFTSLWSVRRKTLHYIYTHSCEVISPKILNHFYYCFSEKVIKCKYAPSLRTTFHISEEGYRKQMKCGVVQCGCFTVALSFSPQLIYSRSIKKHKIKMYECMFYNDPENTKGQLLRWHVNNLDVF